MSHDPEITRLQDEMDDSSVQAMTRALNRALAQQQQHNPQPRAAGATKGASQAPGVNRKS